MANPLVRLEFMRRFRGQAAAWGIPLVVLLPGLAVTAIYGSTVAVNSFQTDNMMNDPMNGMGGPAVDQAVGLGMFSTVAVTLMLTLLVLIPAFVGGSIAGERHSQTLQPLQLTAMTPGQIIYGKLISSLAYLALLLACVAPVLVIPYMLGGLQFKTLLGALLVIMVASIEFAVISLMISAVVSRPAPAIIGSILAVGFLTFAPMILTGLTMVVASAGTHNFRGDTSPLRYISTVSPGSLASLVPLPRGNRVQFVDLGFQILSVLWFLIITAGALAIARHKVTAPVERDR